MQSFDFASALPARTTSPNTQRAYYRWVDRYLVEVAGLKAVKSDQRLERMQRLPVRSLARALSASRLSGWLQTLAEGGTGRQSLDQARAALVTLADLLSEAGIIPGTLADDMRAVHVPSVEHKQEPERLLTPRQIKQVMNAARDMATSHNQRLRNILVAGMLCTMALRREELSQARWQDILLVDQTVFLRIGHDMVAVPASVVQAIDRWRSVVADKGGAPEPHSPLIRRIWKGGRIARDGLSPDGIWLIIGRAAEHANLGHVTPDDLRRSSVAGLHEAGATVEDIRRLLRHRNTLVTERFLARIARKRAVMTTKHDEAGH